MPNTQPINSTQLKHAEASVSLRRAIEFLVAAQHQDGSWCDFQLSVGPSTSWVTAFVLMCLGFVDDQKLKIELTKPKNKAAEFLLSVKRSTGGWGYNESVSEDCDTLAHVILAFRLNNYPVPEESNRRIGDFEISTGRFGTFNDKPPNHSWGLFHHEVSAIATIAMNDPMKAVALRDTLLNEQRRFGYVPCFWWRKLVYSTYICTWLIEKFKFRRSLAKVLERQFVKTFCYDTPVEAAFSGLAALYLDDKIGTDRAAQRLLSTQKKDGSWDGSKFLKEVDPRCAHNWTKFGFTTGLLHEDQHRIYTTAAAARFCAHYIVSRFH